MAFATTGRTGGGGPTSSSFVDPDKVREVLARFGVTDVGDDELNHIVEEARLSMDDDGAAAGDEDEVIVMAPEGGGEGYHRYAPADDEAVDYLRAASRRAGGPMVHRQQASQQRRYEQQYSSVGAGAATAAATHDHRQSSRIASVAARPADGGAVVGPLGYQPTAVTGRVGHGGTAAAGMGMPPAPEVQARPLSAGRRVTGDRAHERRFLPTQFQTDAPAPLGTARQQQQWPPQESTAAAAARDHHLRYPTTKATAGAATTGQRRVGGENAKGDLHWRRAANAAEETHVHRLLRASSVNTPRPAATSSPYYLDPDQQLPGAMFEPTRDNLRFAVMGTKTYLAGMRRPHVAKEPWQRCDPVSRGQSMRRSWDSDPFLSQSYEKKDRWFMRTSMLRWEY